MAMFHLCIKVCSKRGGGKSSVHAAAYRACEAIEDDRTGITHDFTRKGGHVYGEVMLCKNAPAEYQDRAVLWNAVEKVEKNKNAQTSREVEVALPKELDLNDSADLEKAKELLRGYIQENFVDKGMCADWNIHNPDEDNHNPHCHIMLTMRPIKENGEWGQKEKKSYKLDEQGERVPVLDAAKVKKFEKENGMSYIDALKKAETPEKRDEIIFSVQKIGAKNRRMWERELVDSTGWNDQSLAEEWRKDWADKQNALLEELGVEDRVDHRSYERQEIDKVPSIHEGVAKKIFDQDPLGKGFEVDRIYNNVKIEEINSEMSVCEKIMAFCKEKIEVLKDRIEAIKDKVVESIEDTKDFLEGLVRGDISGRTREEDGAADAGRGSPVLRPAFAGEGEPATADVIREARDAVRNARADSGDTESVIQESKSKADSSTAERADRDAERERLEAERAELDGEQDYWDDFEDRGSRGGRW